MKLFLPTKSAVASHLRQQPLSCSLKIPIPAIKHLSAKMPNPQVHSPGHWEAHSPCTTSPDILLHTYSHHADATQLELAKLCSCSRVHVLLEGADSFPILLAIKQVQFKQECFPKFRVIFFFFFFLFFFLIEGSSTQEVL